MARWPFFLSWCMSLIDDTEKMYLDEHLIAKARFAESLVLVGLCSAAAVGGYIMAQLFS